MTKDARELIIRLLIPTVLMGAGLWYLGSLWHARMREQNLILIEPVVIAMVPCYLWVVIFELRRFRNLPSPATARPPASVKPKQTEHILFMAVAVLSVVLFYLVGAIPATIVLVLLGLLVLKVRRPVLLVTLPLTTAFILWLVFIEGFGIRMPLFGAQ